MSKHIIAPSLLAADFSDLKSAVGVFDRSVAKWLHLDVMDGLFVPNISFGIPVIKSIRPLSKKIFDVHLMIEKPERYLQAFKQSGADVLTIHLEASVHAHRSVSAIKELGIKAGIALNPHTPVALLEDIIKDVDLVCLMSVNPGFGGQRFITQTLKKIEKTKALILKTQSKALIQIDGGVTTENATEILNCGADILVAGSTVFKSDDPLKTIERLQSISV